MSAVPTPRIAAEWVIPVQVTVTLTTTVPVLASESDPAATAQAVIDDEVGTFCADFDWEQTSLTVRRGHPAGVGAP